MPATITHHTFAQDVFNCLPKKIKKNIDEDLLYTFSQSTDAFMFYNVESLKKGKDIRKLQKITHTTKTQEFFITLTSYINDNNFKYNKQIMSFLYGFICHYVLDSNMHPYICYRTGMFNRKDKTTYKYMGQHAIMETYLDNYILKTRYKKNYNNLTKKDLKIHLKEFNNELNTTIDYIFYKVYEVNNISKIYYKAIKQMKRFITRYRIDNLGIKKSFYSIANKIIPYKYDFRTLSYHYNNDEMTSYLNNNHDTWYYPTEPTISSNESFEEIYIRSKKEALKIIENINLYFNNEAKSLKNVFTNKSYLTGLDCNKETIFKKFYF